ncbi:hypothetical protein GGI12_003993 [Dipsacomyces acuminosporus]|nr:hypothetical protein GGI12_003993 [Dipsacomyces acuminosporus]
MTATISINKLIRDRLKTGAIYAATSTELKTRSEKRIVQMSSAIRNKPQWFEKMNDKEIRQRWTNEAKAQNLTDKEIDYVFDELAYYASLRVPGSGVELSGVEGVWISDSLVDKETLKELKDYAAILENVPEKNKDYHPNSNDQVLNLIHPSLFPLIYRKSSFLSTPIPSPEAAVKLATFGKFPRSIRNWRWQLDEAFRNEEGKPELCVSSDLGCSFTSSAFSWLPSEFRVDKDGNATIESYINNLHPIKHAALYPTIAKIFSSFVPMLEQVVTDLVHPRGRRVVPDCYGWYRSDEPEPVDYDAEDYDERYEQWKENKIFVDPQPEPFAAPNRPTITYSLRGRRLQAIVKMSNIELTPDNPVYEGGNWHVEAMANERIIATGIYYYDVENITESKLEFRESVDEEVGYEQDDDNGVRQAYDIYDGREDVDRHYEGVKLVQPAGSVEVRNGRCICFPNVYQHLVSGFKLADPTKPGHRKIFAFFFIDPSTRIPSTEIVPPQQKDWWAPDALNAGPLKDLPLLVKDAINDNVDFPLSLEEAKELRLELMEERSVSNESASDYFAPEFCLCEH